jgi:hypothetical protein
MYKLKNILASLMFSGLILYSLGIYALLAWFSIIVTMLHFQDRLIYVASTRFSMQKYRYGSSLLKTTPNLSKTLPQSVWQPKMSKLQLKMALHFEDGLLADRKARGLLSTSTAICLKSGGDCDSSSIFRTKLKRTS